MTPLPADPFSTTPKTNPQSFYDREAELHQLQQAINEGRRLILVLGIRRVGKTSLIRVALNQLGKPYIFIDLRALETYEDRSLYSLLSEELNRVAPLSKKILQFLKRVRGISIGDGVISLSLGREKPSIISILKMLDVWAVDENITLPIILDEAQELRFFRGGRRRIDFRKIIAYCYDNLERTVFILSGSEVGLLYSFIGVEDSKSPLYGRHYVLIRLDRLDRESSIDFLKKGFEYHGVKHYEGFAEKAVEEFDGVVGWLTYFGAEVVRLYGEGIMPTPEELAVHVKSKAVNLYVEELEKLASRSRLYIGILSSLKPEGNSWSDIRLALEKTFKRTVSKQQLSVLLRNLEDLSIIKKEDGVYRVLDPVTVEAANTLLRKRFHIP